MMRGTRMRRGKHALGRQSLLLLLCGGAALAEDIPSAVGRISYGDTPAPGAAICTGVLVAPDLVLTAGHCVRTMADDPAVIRFDAGWIDGRPAGRGQGAKVLLEGSDGPAEDVALVVLEAPFSAEVASPLPLASPATGEFTLHAFRRDVPDHPAEPSTCNQITALPGLLGLDCPAVSGNSGAPLLQRVEGGWQVVAVMVAASDKGPIRSWATLLPEWVLQRSPFPLE